MKIPTLLFTYGTLKQGFCNNRVISNGTLLGNHETPPIYTLYDLGAYPAVTLEGNTSVTGEVWEIEDLVSTDYLEGYPYFYDRVQLPTKFGMAWIYFLPHHRGTVITSGKWGISA